MSKFKKICAKYCAQISCKHRKKETCWSYNFVYIVPDQILRRRRKWRWAKHVIYRTPLTVTIICGPFSIIRCAFTLYDVLSSFIRCAFVIIRWAFVIIRWAFIIIRCAFVIIRSEFSNVLPPHFQIQIALDVVKVGHKLLLPVGNTWNSFVKFRRLSGGHTCHIKRATCNILICLWNIVILRKSGGEKVNIFLK